MIHHFTTESDIINNALFGKAIADLDLSEEYDNGSSFGAELLNSAHINSLTAHKLLVNDVPEFSVLFKGFRQVQVTK